MTENKRSKITELHIQEATRLKALWDSRPHRTQAVFGEHYDLGNQANVGHYLNARSPLNPKAAKAFAAELGCSVADFSPRVAEELSMLSSGLPEGEFQSVRRASVSFANGTGRVQYVEDDRPALVFRTDFLRKLGIATGDAVVVDADGNSNYPKILDGSVVLLNQGDRERLNGDFFAFRYDGELLIKRLQKVEGVGIIATAESSDFKPKMKVYGPQDLDQLEIIGRAVWTGAEL